jgi:hypothetical protein
MTDIAEISRLVEGYRDWLKDRTAVRSLHAGWVEITTPFLDRHNDYLQIYARGENGGIRLTDDGNTLRDLEASGCALDTPRRRSILMTALNGFGIEEADGALRTLATPTNFAFRKHALLQAILAVNDMFYLSSSSVKSLFKEDVEAWLLSQEIRFVPNIQFTGKSGYQHYFDFAIPASKRAPERIIRAIANPNKDAALNFIQAWTDTQEQRPQESLAVAILNDGSRPIGEPVLAALRQYDVLPIRWSGRQEHEGRLAA